MNSIRTLLVSVIALPSISHAQAPDQSCNVGDSACYQRRYEGSCAPIGTTTVQSCKTWIGHLEDQASQGNRNARRALGSANAAIGLYLSKEPIEQAQYRDKALAIYRQLVAGDPNDVDALVGVATFAQGRAERLDSLRQAVKLQPSTAIANLLVAELRSSGNTNDLLEGAQVAESVYRNSEGLAKWNFGAFALDLYEEAGARTRVVALKERMREDFRGNALLNELSDAIDVAPERAVSISESLCQPEVVQGVGAEFCIKGIEIVVPSLPELADRSQARLLADRSARLLIQVVDLEATRALSDTEPLWRAKFAQLLDGIIQRGLESGRVYQARALLEPRAERQLSTLEEALRVTPNDATVLLIVASEYMQQQRWEEALALYQRAKELPATQSIDQQRMLEHNIQQAEKMLNLGR